MRIDYTQLKAIASDKHQKGKDCKVEANIRSNMYPFAKNYLQYLESLDCYEVSTIMLDYGHWEKSRKKSFDSTHKPYDYHIREIVMVNLGACNYGYEASYNHPCIILANGYNWAMVIPCSTGRYSKKSDYILKGEIVDGFKYPTGIQLDKIRVIDKWRIEGKVLGMVTPGKFQDINNQLIHLYFPQIEKTIDKLEEKCKTITEENEKLKKQIESLQAK